MRYFFIHNYKTLGTTIMTQLPEIYKRLFYGQCTLAEYEARNKLRLNRIPKFSGTWDTNTISFDHLHLDTLFDLGLLGPRNVKNMKCVMLVRDPIDRFISICNYENKSPTQFINNIKNGTDNGRHQHTYAEGKHKWNVMCIKSTSSQQIIKFFQQFGILINLSVNLNVSQKKFSRKNLTGEQLTFLTQLYATDYALFRKAL
jgi:hypothetical protein